jgi:predicted amidohydrolase YtcJ
MHMKISRALAIGALLAAVGCGGPATDPQEQTAPAQAVDVEAGPADVILSNGKIITVDDKFTIAQAVAIKGDRVIAVGATQDVNRLAGPSTRTIDLNGRAVVPGMIDNHAHYMEEGVLWTDELRLDGIETRKQAVEMMQAKAASLPPERWVYTLGGWSPDQFTDDKRSFSREELDSIVDTHPVLLQFTRAETYVNSRAIEILGLEKMTQPWIMRDASGRSTGVIDAAGAGFAGANQVAEVVPRPNTVWLRRSATMRFIQLRSEKGERSSASTLTAS